VEGTRAALASSTTAFMDQLGDARLCLGRTLDQAEAAETQCGALQALLAAARAKQVALEAELQQRRLLIDANSRCAAQSVAVEAALGALTAALQRVEGAAGAAGAPADAAAGAAVGTLVIDGLNQDPVLLLLAAPATAGLAPALAALASRQRTSAAAAASSAGSLLTGLRATEAEDGGAPTVEPCLSGTELPALLAACAAPASPALASLLVLAPPRGLVLLRGVSPPGTAEGATGERLELDSRGRVLHTLPPAGGAPPLSQRGRQFALVVQLLAAQAALAGALEPARSAATQAPWALLPRAGASPRLLRLLRGATPVGAPLAPLAPPAAPLSVSVLMDLSGVTVSVPAPAGGAARLTFSGRGRADEGFLACLAHHGPSGAGEYSLALRGLEALEAYAERVAAIGAGLQELLGELQGEAAAAPQGQALLLVSYAVPTPPAVLQPALAAAEAAEAAEAAAAADAALAAPWAAGAAAAGSLQAGAAGVEAGLAAAGKAQAAALAGDERVARRGGVEGEKLVTKAVVPLVLGAVPKVTVTPPAV
jgi:hypothetical protein